MDKRIRGMFSSKKKKRLEKGKNMEFDWKRSALVAGVVSAAILLRVALALWMGTTAQTPLEELYVSLALEWRETFQLALNGTPTAVVMPFYPLFLGIASMIFPGAWVPVGLAHAFLGGAGAWFAYRIAVRTFHDDRLGWIVFGLAAFYPPLVLAAARLDPLVVIGFLLALGIWLLTLNFDDVQHLLVFMAAAVVFSAAILVTGEILALIPVLGLWAGVRSYHRGIGILCGSAFCLACLVALMPWMGRNFLSFGTLVPITTGWPVTLERSLVELTSSGSTPPISDPREDMERKIAATGGETFAYQESLKSVLEKTGSLGWGDYFRWMVRGITFWISDYLPILNPSHESASAASMAIRVFFMTVTILCLLLAGLGLVLSVANLNAWLLLAPLLIATGLASAFNLPGYRHLAYSSLFYPFLAVGGLACYGWAQSFLSGAPRTGPNRFDIPLDDSPSGDPPALFEPDRPKEPPPLWPVEENRSRLEPIRQNRKGAETLKANRREEE